jgi:hypothetical protein
MANHCDNDDRYDNDYPCTMEARAALNVNVTLNGNSAITTDGITVTARDGNYIEDLLPVIPDTPTFSGAYERAGNYIVTVRKAGYQDYVSNNISVARPLPRDSETTHGEPDSRIVTNENSCDDRSFFMILGCLTC